MKSIMRAMDVLASRGSVTFAQGTLIQPHALGGRKALSRPMAVAASSGRATREAVR